MREKTQDRINAIIANDNLPEEERLTQKQLGEKLGVSGPRICQLRATLRPKAENVETHTPETAEASESVVEAA